jgi:hypothetical protein
VDGLNALAVLQLSALAATQFEGPSSLTRVTRLGLSLGALLVVMLGVWMYLGQRSGKRIGGASAPAKSVWLGYVVYLWFIAAPLLASDPAVNGGLRLTLGTFAANMWLRGIVELALLYGFKRWRPPYGICHDIFSIILIVGLVAGSWSALWPPGDALNLWTAGLVVVVVVTLVLETWYALVFNAVVGEATQGNEGIWFAPSNHPKLTRTVRMTARCNALLLVFLGAYLAVVLSPPRRRLHCAVVFIRSLVWSC